MASKNESTLPNRMLWKNTRDKKARLVLDGKTPAQRTIVLPGEVWDAQDVVDILTTTGEDLPVRGRKNEITPRVSATNNGTIARSVLLDELASEYDLESVIEQAEESKSAVV
jgi:hypothetical protein